VQFGQRQAIRPTIRQSHRIRVRLAVAQLTFA
jgi:hypothetical protein